MLDAETYEKVLHWFYDVSMENKIQTKATCAPHYFRVMRQRAEKEGIQIRPETHGMAAMTKGCLAGTGVCFVSHKGAVFPCGYLPVEAGNIRTQSLREIWDHSPVFVDLRNPEALRGKCGVCEYKQVCEGCRARAYFARGHYLEEEPYCTYVPERVRQERRAAQ
jgi:radical SAM protein with 4Fe4S-binding SPASM domain